VASSSHNCTGPGHKCDPQKNYCQEGSPTIKCLDDCFLCNVHPVFTPFLIFRITSAQYKERNVTTIVRRPSTREKKKGFAIKSDGRKSETAAALAIVKQKSAKPSSWSSFRKYRRARFIGFYVMRKFALCQWRRSAKGE